MAVSSLVSRFTKLFSWKSPITNEPYHDILQNLNNGKLQKPEDVVKKMTNHAETRQWVDFAIKELSSNQSLKAPDNFKKFFENLPYNKDATNYSKLAKDLKSKASIQE